MFADKNSLSVIVTQKQPVLTTIVSWSLRYCLLIPLLYGMSISTLLAVPIAITNPGFEDISGESPFNEFTFGPLDGWDLYDPNLITSGGAGGTYFIGTLTPFEPDPIGSPGEYANFPDGAAEGQRVGIAFNFQGSDGQGEYGFEQVLNVTLQANTLYTLQVEIGNIDSATAMNGTFFSLAGFPGYRVDLFTRDLGGVMKTLIRMTTRLQAQSPMESLALAPSLAPSLSAGERRRNYGC